LYQSGLLASYSFLKQAKKRNLKESTKIELFLTVTRYYLRRLWRISPTYYLTLLVSVGLTRFLVYGPFYNEYESFIVNSPLSLNMCREYFWTNLLYINLIRNVNSSNFSILYCNLWFLILKIPGNRLKNKENLNKSTVVFYII